MSEPTTNTEAYYYISWPVRRCENCKYRNYDSFHDESWCGHKPKPNGLGERLLVEPTGCCEYWEALDDDA